MIGDFLYQLQPQESVSAPVIQRFIARRITTLAAGAIDIELVSAPLDKALMITSFSAQAASGTAQLATGIRVLVLDSVANTLYRYRDEPVSRMNVVGLTIFDMNEVDVNWLLMAGERFIFEATYDAGVNPNTLDVSAHGFFIPKGNLQLR